MKNPLIRRSILDDSIDRVLEHMKGENPGTEDYEALLADLERLVKLRSEEQSKRVSPDTMAIVAANIFSVLVVVGYEQGHVVISRGLNFLLRTKHQ